MGRRDKSHASTKKKRGGKLQQSPVSPPQQEAPMFSFDGDANNHQPEPDQVQPPAVGDPAPIFRFGAVPSNAQVTQTKNDVGVGVKASEEERPELRFNIGDRVYCNFGRDGWESGTIAIRHCRRDDDGRYHPYYVQLDKGGFVFVPYDNDKTIMKSDEKMHPTNLRYIVGDRVDCRIHNGTTEEWVSGTVILRNGNLKSFKEQNTTYKLKSNKEISLDVVPYNVRLDGGGVAAVPIDNDNYIKQTIDPAKLKVFKVGSRVDICFDKAKDEWASGTVSHISLDWVDIDPIHGAPYHIILDYNRTVGTHKAFWGPFDCIRESDVAAPANVKVDLRFSVGDRVECMVPDKAGNTNNFNSFSWSPGTIVQTNYTVSSEENFVAPYQIQLDVGRLIFAPADNDSIIRRSNIPAPTCWICYDDTQSFSNPILRECACRGESNGYVHVDCLVKLAIAKAGNKNEEGIDDENLFTQCITCKQEFKKDSHSFYNLAVGCFKAFGNEANIGKPWNGLATSMIGTAQFAKGNDDRAIGILLTRCSMIVNRRNDKSVQLSYKEAFQLMLDHARLMYDISFVYEKKGELDTMKTVLDKSLALIKALEIEKGTPSRRKVNILSSLATHAYLVGDKGVAMERYEECISLTRGQAKENDMLLATLLLKSGNLELEIGNREREGLSKYQSL